MRALSAGTTLVGSDTSRVDLVFEGEDVHAVHCEFHVTERRVAIAPFPGTVVIVNGSRTERPLMLPATASVVLGAAAAVELLITQGDDSLPAPRALTVEELLAWFPAHVSEAHSASSASESYFHSEGSSSTEVRVKCATMCSRLYTQPELCCRFIRHPLKSVTSLFTISPTFSWCY